MNESKLHIVMISTWFPAPDNTAWICVCGPADALIRVGNNVSVFMFQYFSPITWLKKILKKGDLQNQVPGEYFVLKIWEFVNFYPTRFSSNPIALQKKSFLRYIEKQFKKYVQKNGKPDIIHHHGIADFCYITAHLSQTFGIPYVLTEHSPDPDKTHFNAYETIEERLEMIRKASARIAVSTFYQKQYEAIFGVPFVTIPNMVSDAFAKTPLPILPKPLNPFNFIHIGSFSKTKRHDILIQAFSAAFKNNMKVHLILVGKGDLENEIRDLIISLGIEKQIHLYGYKKRDELLQLLDEVHVLVVSSDNETFSLAAAEALFRGNPVLTSRCGGPEDFVNENNGLVCNVNDVTDMQEKLLKIYTNYSSYNLTKIAQDVHNRFSERTVVNKLEKLYKMAISPES